MCNARLFLIVAITAACGSGCSHDDSTLECVLTRTSMCHFSSNDVASSVTWNRGDAVLELSWIPLAQTDGICTPGTDGCFAYSFDGTSTLDDTFDVNVNGVAFHGSHEGTYTLGPVTQDCPITEMTLTCAGSPNCELDGDYTVQSEQ